MVSRQCKEFKRINKKLGIMKIIKEGKLPTNRIYGCTCAVCNTQVEYTGEDIKYNGRGIYIECPLCKDRIKHDGKDNFVREEPK